MRIKAILQEKGMTSKNLAEKLGMTPTGMSLIISGKGNPPLKRLQQIADALGVKVRDLFDDSPLMETLECPKCGAKVKIAITSVSIDVVQESPLSNKSSNPQNTTTEQ